MRSGLTLAAIDASYRITRDEPFETELTERLEHHFDTDAGSALARFRFGGELPSTFTVSGGTPLDDVQIRARIEMAPRHPTWRSDLIRGAPATVRLSDLVTLRRFWGTEPYQVIHAVDDGRYPATAVLRSTRHELVFLVLHRRQRDFSDAEMADLAAIQAPLAAALAFREVLDRLVAHVDVNLASTPMGTGNSPTSTTDSVYKPTRRESEVLALAAAGFTNQRIGNRLGISERTVRKHLSAIYDKTMSSGRAAATAWWQRQQSVLHEQR